MADKPLFIGSYRNEKVLCGDRVEDSRYPIFCAAQSGSRIHAINAFHEYSEDIECDLLFHPDVGDDFSILGRFTIPRCESVSLLDPGQLKFIDQPPGRFITLGAEQCLSVEISHLDAELHVTVFAGDY